MAVLNHSAQCKDVFPELAGMLITCHNITVNVSTEFGRLSPSA